VHCKRYGDFRFIRLAFADSNQVNTLFERLAHSLLSGDLSKTTATEVRVSTHPLEDPENGAPNRHSLAIEIPNLYDAEQAKEVRKPHPDVSHSLTNIYCDIPGNENVAKGSRAKVVWSQTGLVYCNR
jgi:hypothetical protein